MIGCGDHHRIKRFLLSEQFLIVGVRLDIAGLGLVPVLGTGNLIGVDIAKSHNMVPELERVTNMTLYLAAHADEGDVKPVVRPENGAREKSRRDSGSSKKSSAFHGLSLIHI